MRVHLISPPAVWPLAEAQDAKALRVEEPIAAVLHFCCEPRSNTQD
jgi:hypothetical protein